MKLQLQCVSVVAVIVTYGNRLPLVQRVFSYLETEPLVTHIVLVDNGSHPTVRSNDITTSKSFKLVSHSWNGGSAVGFGAGIAEALAIDGADYIFVLDDDNVCVEGYGIEKIVELAFSIEAKGQVIISALRQDRVEYMQLLNSPEREQVITNSFLGFHVKELLRKVIGRSMSNAKQGTQVSVRAVKMAPYGGLFMPARLAASVDLPDPAFVLYGDDHEYTLRMSDAGISMYLTDIARIQDIDQSWSVASKKINPWIDSNSDEWRIYYSSRNRAYLERSRFVSNHVVYLINAIFYFAFLLVSSIRNKRSVKKSAIAISLLFDGVKAGWSGRLGYCEKYPIPYGRPPNKIDSHSIL